MEAAKLPGPGPPSARHVTARERPRKRRKGARRRRCPPPRASRPPGPGPPGGPGAADGRGEPARVGVVATGRRGGRRGGARLPAAPPAAASATARPRSAARGSACAPKAERLPRGPPSPPGPSMLAPPGRASPALCLPRRRPPGLRPGSGAGRRVPCFCRPV